MMKKYYLFLISILFLGFSNAQNVDDINCNPIEGCTDEQACNYDADANIDDESCFFCYDNDCETYPNTEWACNGICIDSNENGTCDFNEIGCSDALACNAYYFEDGNGDLIIATEDDGSCTYPVPDFDCNGNCIDVDNDSICDKVDDFICEFDTDSDGVCDDVEIFSECSDETACNYVVGSTETYNSNPSITMPEDMEMIDSNGDGNFGCVYPTDADENPTIWFNCDGTCVDNDNDNVCDEVDNCPDDPQNDADNDGVCANDEIFGCTESDAFNYDVSATENDGSCIPVVEGCTDEDACNYSASANTEDGSCVTLETLEANVDGVCFDCEGVCLDYDNDGVCFCAEIEGCTDNTAFNFDILATEDDDSCIATTEGCTDPTLENGDATGNYCFDCNTSCPDTDNDGVGDCCEPIIEGCTDEDACNYDATANTDDNSCTSAVNGFDCGGECIDIDDDGVCDLADDCVGTVISFDTDEDGENDCDVCDDSNYAATYVLGTCDGVCVNGDDDNDGVCNDYEINGCTDENACNFDEDATEDDGSCFNPLCDSDCVEGVFTDGDTDNDGVCNDDEMGGCTDADACNYDVTATDDDGSCEYPLTGYNCDGSCANDDGDDLCDLADDCVGTYDICGICNGDGPTQDYYTCEFNSDTGEYDEVCILDTDGDGVCDENEVEGCTDVMACNYDPLATDQLPGSCEGLIGCGLPWMSNFNPLFDEDCEGDDCGNATCLSNAFYDENEFCVVFSPGCYDVNACNYEGIISDENPNELAGAVDDGSCEYTSCSGCTDMTACNYDEFATIDDDEECLYTADFANSDGDCAYFDLDTDGDGVMDYMEVSGCTDSNACNFDSDATDDDGSCEDGCDTCNYDDDGNYVDMTDGDTDGDGVCDLDEVEGCMDILACNYDPLATNDDGSCSGTVGCNIPSFYNGNMPYDCLSNDYYDENEACIEYVYGCMDPLACNYDENANSEINITCDFADQYYNCDGECINDCDGDGICDENELTGCTDPSACNTTYYDANGNIYNTPDSGGDNPVAYTIATDNDGSCVPYSCGQEWSLNYNPDAGVCVDNTLCIEWAPGCTDALACNYDTAANADDGSCYYATTEITDPICQECELVDGEWVVVDILTEDCGFVFGCTDPEATNYDPNANTDDGSCVYLTIEEITSSFELLVYPNPADNFITVELDSNNKIDAKIMVINQLGQIVDSRDISTLSSTIIDVANYPSGLYQVTVATHKDVVNRSLMIR